MDEYYSDTESDNVSEIVEEICVCQNDTPVSHNGLCEYCEWKTHYYSGSLEDYTIYNPFWLQHFNQMGRFTPKVERTKDGTRKEVFLQARRIINEPNIIRNTPKVDINKMTYLKYVEPITPPPVEKPHVKNWAGLFKNEKENLVETIYDLLHIPNISSPYETKKAYRKIALKMMSDKKKSNDNKEKDIIQAKFDKLEKMFNDLKV